MGDLNQGLQQAKGIQLAIRMGIHTGWLWWVKWVVAGRQEQLALGETPNVAARIQGLAAPNTVAIVTPPIALVQGYFSVKPWGTDPPRCRESTCTASSRKVVPEPSRCGCHPED